MYYDGISPKRNIAAANKLARDGIKFVIGHPFSDCAVPASDVYEDKRVLMISPAATSPELTAHGHRLTFRTVGTDDVQEQVLRCVIGVCKFNYSLFFLAKEDTVVDRGTLAVVSGCNKETKTCARSRFSGRVNWRSSIAQSLSCMALRAIDRGTARDTS
jgi:hypothetical protein